MWNLLEKGKAFAENIDRQLNESVGVDSAPSSSGAPTATATSTNDDDGLNDAWNDDFGDDDDDEELLVAPTSKPTPSPQEEPPKMETVEPTEPQNSGWDEHDNDAAVDMQSEAPKEKVILPIPTEQSSLLPEIAPTPQTRDDEAPKVVNEQAPEPVSNGLHAVPDQEDVVSSSPTEDTPPSQAPQKPQESSVWEEEMYEDGDDVDGDDDGDKDAVDDGGADEVEQVEKEAPPEQAEPQTREVSVPPQQAEPSNDSHDDSSNKRDVVDAELLHKQNQKLQQLQSQMEHFRSQLRQREDQLAQKAEQLTMIQAMHDTEANDLKQKIKDTKEEAKRRIQKAKEKVDSMETAMKSAGKSAEELAEKDEIIAALREEGEKLARKQSEMEKSVRSARGDTRELQHALDEETTAKEHALDKVAALEIELKSTKEDLFSARKGESQASKLEIELANVKEELEAQAAGKLSLELQVKEYKSEIKGLKKEMNAAQKGAQLESKRESSKLKKEHGDMLSEMELKFRNSEREAGVREDALRQEVSDLRKRWQDAVRRADALSMDVQSSTAPLLRQLESMERQNRARSSAWAEQETSLRTELENNVIENEKLTKERNDLKVSLNRFKRISKERDDELTTCKATIEEQIIKIEKLEAQVQELEAEAHKRQEAYEEVERLANEGASRVRSEMTRTVLESEERYRAQIKSIENELSDEKSKRTQLERQVEELLENAGMMVVPIASNMPIKKEKPKKLRSAEGQADILAKSLSGLNDDEDDEDDNDDDNDVVEEEEKKNALRSFAAMEQLSQRLKAAKVELEALRKSLTASEKTRDSLVEELSETRQAKEKLPLFEEKVRELTADNRRKEMEILSLTEDVAEVRQLYRSQLNSLLEEKAASLVAETTDKTADAAPSVQEEPTNGAPAEAFMPVNKQD